VTAAADRAGAGMGALHGSRGMGREDQRPSERSVTAAGDRAVLGITAVESAPEWGRFTEIAAWAAKVNAAVKEQ